MKFGNYNINTPPKEKQRKLDFLRFHKLKLSTPHFIERFHNRFETFRRLKSRSESPLSFRASLFEKDGSIFSRAICEKFSPNDFPKKHFAEDNFYVFGNMVRKIGIQKPITGKNYHVTQNYYTTVRSSMKKLPLLKNQNNCTNSTKRNKVKRQNSTLKDILDSSIHLDEDVEFKVLKDYFETNSYSDIVNDPDFKSYLSKKNYGDILDYMNDNSLGGVAASSQHSSYDGSLYKQNLCRNRMNYDVGRLSKSKSTGNLYESLNYYNNVGQCEQSDLNSSKHALIENGNGLCNSLKRLKRVFKSPNVLASGFTPQPDIFEKCKNSCQHTERYNEIKKFCQLFLEENHEFDKKVKNSTLGKEYTERSYKKLIARFIKSKGYESIDEYVYAKFGCILDQTVSYDLVDNNQPLDYSKNYTENIPRRYHVTKQKFLEAEFSRNINRNPQSNNTNCYFANHNTQQSRDRTTGGTIGVDHHSINQCKRNPIKSNYSFKSTSSSSALNMKYGDYCFKKRYYNNVNTIGSKYGTMMSGNDHCASSSKSKQYNSLPSYWRNHRNHHNHQQQHRHRTSNNSSRTNNSNAKKNHNNYGHNWSSSKNDDLNMNYVK